ncbi:jak pathway signal transduction adaptor molecule [Anaeramoeba ignava]|uniref:Jak pathway signal transduction adaptor molecule n=1 Tax=Anaeramoeba ignava TaxID=1746090 RepID=A0A9Q0LFM7_ANAIG|nr:jak pathway signal transduction adaptor molecule [Anaeramoeba ignava]
MIEILQKDESGWWMAKKLTKDSKKGLIPSSYIEILTDFHPESETESKKTKKKSHKEKNHSIAQSQINNLIHLIHEEENAREKLENQNSSLQNSLKQLREKLKNEIEIWDKIEKFLDSKIQLKQNESNESNESN